MAKKAKKVSSKKPPKKRPELDDDLHDEIITSNSLPDRIEKLLIQILRELKKTPGPR